MKGGKSLIANDIEIINVKIFPMICFEFLYYLRNKVWFLLIRKRLLQLSNFKDMLSIIANFLYSRHWLVEWVR